MEMDEKDFKEVLSTFLIPKEGLAFHDFLDRFGTPQSGCSNSSHAGSGASISGAADDQAWGTLPSDAQSESDDYSVYGDISSVGSDTPRTGMWTDLYHMTIDCMAVVTRSRSASPRRPTSAPSPGSRSVRGCLLLWMFHHCCL